MERLNDMPTAAELEYREMVRPFPRVYVMTLPWWPGLVKDTMILHGYPCNTHTQLSGTVLKTAHQLDERHGARASNLVHATPKSRGKSMCLRSIMHSAATLTAVHYAS